MATHILTLACPDRKGIVAEIAAALVKLNANILQNAQFTDPSTGTFCMRTRLDVDIDESADIADRLMPITEALKGRLQVRRGDQNRRVLVMVSKYDHCLVDLLYRKESGELPIELPVVVSNHTKLRDTVLRHGLEFEHLPLAGDTKPAAERHLLNLVKQHRVDFVVLARYMQILSNELCAQMPGRIINIHHSFLPGFKGAKPYHQAWERGVKLIGATAHYVTADLDEGPIICQDVGSVSHRDDPQQMVTKGRDIERLVLAEAVKAQAEDRIFLLDNARTILFR